MNYRHHEIAKRSTTALMWRGTAMVAVLVIVLIRSVLLARLLPVEVFGIYAFAAAIIRISGILPRFGTDSALLYKSPMAGDEETAAAVHFSFRMLLTMIWLVLAASSALLFTSGSLQTALLTLVAAHAGLQLAGTAQILLIRHIVHRRLAIIAVLNAAITTPIAILWALKAPGLWPLLSIDLISCLITLLALYLWRPLWRPRFAWSPKVIRYLSNFGVRQLTTELFLHGMRSLDKLWIGIVMDTASLGLYSRAFVFGLTPSRLLIQPVVPVVAGVFAEFSNKPDLFSRSAFLITVLVIWLGCLLAGCLLVVAPEFILLLLGEKWLPMLTSFRILLIAGLFLSVNNIIAHIYLAKGIPGRLMRIRGFQLMILLAALILLTPRAGFDGAAIAFLLSNLIGTLISLPKAEIVERQPFRKLFLIPTLILLCGYLATWWFQIQSPVTESLITAIVIKLGIFIASFIALSLILERQLLKELYGFVYRQLRTLRV